MTIKRIYLVVLIAVLGIAGCKTNNTAEKDAVKYVEVETPVPYSSGLGTEYIGKVLPKDEINIAFRVAGTLQSIPVEVGETVRKGQTIASLDKRDYKTQLLATQAEYSQIKGEAERIIELYRRKSVPQNTYDKAVFGLEQITAKLTAHENALADCELKAPLSGRVQHITFHIGETVDVGMPVISMVGNTDFEIEIFVPATAYNQIQGEHRCQIGKQTEKTYTAQFVSVTPKANANGLYATRFKIKGADDGDIIPGMNGVVTISRNPSDSKLLTISLASVFERDNESFVWVLDKQQNKVSAQRIKMVELLQDGNVVVENGLTTNEWVVVAGIHSISEKDEVYALPKDSKTNIGGLK